jgi:hypothetical protein
MDYQIHISFSSQKRPEKENVHPIAPLTEEGMTEGGSIFRDYRPLPSCVAEGEAGREKANSGISIQTKLITL